MYKGFAMEPHIQSNPGIPAPYGQTCRNCSRAKLKCITQTVGGSCERCHRLNKECRPSVTVRQRNAKKSGVSKTAQLEDKLDGIVSLLKSATHSTPVTADPNGTTMWNVGHANNVQANSTVSSNPILLTPIATGSDSTSYPSPIAHVHSAFEPSPYEAEEYLRTFSTQKAKYFPFVNIPSTTSAQHLLQEQPFLWLCIMAISTKSTSQQSALGRKIRDTLARTMLCGCEKNLDLLLGLIIYIAWTNCQVRDKPSLSVFVHLATSLVFDLGLNKSPSKDPEVIFNFKSYGCPKPSRSIIRTMEERRAVLGCFLVSSIISSYLQRIDALRWTPHMDECLQVLAEKQEYPTDEVLVQQVRLQLIVEKVAQAAWHDGETENAESTRVPPAFYLKALQLQLQEVKHKIPPNLQQNEIVLAHLYSTDLTIHENALSKTPIISNNSDFQRLENLYACLNSIKSWFDVFFKIPPAAYFGFPFPIVSQLAHCLVVLYRLSTLDDPAWDKDVVRNTANLLLILNQVSNNMGQAAELAGLDSDSTERNVFDKAAKTILSIKLGWEAKLAVEPMGQATLTGQNVDETVPEISMDFYNDAWLTDILVSWDS